MRASILEVLLAAVALCCNQASAQQAGKPVPTSQHPRNLDDKSQGSAQRAAEPSAELRSLTNILSGKWSLEVKSEPSPGMTNGVTRSGEETWRAGPGGFTLIEDERLPTPAGDVFLLGIIWWDNRTKSFHGMECNSQLPYTCDLKGALNDITMNWDGKQFAIEEQETHNGKKTLWHEVWSDITATSFTQTGESEQPDGSRKMVFTIHAKRVSDSGK
jgi:hypothetical protein